MSVKNIIMKKKAYKTTFSSSLKVVDEENKNISKASLLELKNFLPNINLDENSDLQLFASNACVVNLANLNGDCINTEVALSIAKNFQNKPINIEHNRKEVLGHIVNYGYSSFDPNYSIGGGSYPLEEKDLKNYFEPFNIVVAGVLYHMNYPVEIDSIVSSSDPLSNNYLSWSLSFELAFSNYSIMLGSRDFSRATIISNEEEIENYKQYLIQEGGSGFTPDNVPVHRIIHNKDEDDYIIPLGCAVTRNPAAFVKGIVVPSEQLEFFLQDEPSINTLKKQDGALNLNISSNEEKIISQNKENDVKINNNFENSQNTKDTKMPQDQEKLVLASLEDVKSLTDENVEKYSVANISDLIESAIKEASDKFESEIQKEKDSKIKAEKDLEDAMATLQQLQEKMDKIEAEKMEAEKQETFNNRMSLLEKSYDLSDNQKEIVANQIADLDEKGFEDWKAQFDVLHAEKKTCSEKEKGKAEDKKDKVESEKDTKVEDKDEEDKKSLDEAKANVDFFANTLSDEQKGLLDKYQEAFSSKHINISPRKR